MSSNEADAYASVTWREVGTADRRQLTTLLSHLTAAAPINEPTFARQLTRMRAAGTVTMVAEDVGSRQLLATGSLHVLEKFVHGCAKVGQIEDVVVDPRARRRGLGQELVRRLVQAARERGCYKVMLNCAEHRVGWYEHCGLQRKEVQMVRYF